jgi:hypothetical protein
VANAAGVEQFQLMREKRLPGHGHKRFGNFFRDGAQARGETAGEYGDRDLGKREIHT